MSPKCKIKIINLGITLKTIRITKPQRDKKNLKMKTRKHQNKNNVNLANLVNVIINHPKRQQLLRIRMRINGLLISRMISRL